MPTEKEGAAMTWEERTEKFREQSRLKGIEQQEKFAEKFRAVGCAIVARVTEWYEKEQKNGEGSD